MPAVVAIVVVALLGRDPGAVALASVVPMFGVDLVHVVVGGRE